MLRGIFDSPWQLVIVLLVVVVVFGSKRLPDAARGLGRSLRIFKSEVKQMQDESRPAAPTGAAAPAERSDVPVTPEPLEGRIVEPQAGRTSADQRHEA